MASSQSFPTERLARQPIRLLALDIDGTLLNRAGQLLPSTIEAVRQAQDAGIKPVLCTGRRYRRTYPIAQMLGLDQPLVCNSGAVIKSRDGQTSLWRADFHPTLTKSALAMFDAAGFIPLSFLDGSPDSPDFWARSDPDECPMLNDYLLKNRPHGRIDPHWRDHIETHGHYHLCGFGGYDELVEFEATIQQKFGDQVQTFVQKSPSYRGFACEILRGDANKWTAVNRLATSWGIAPQEICAVGDDMNDLPMIQNAGLGVAMGHAPQEVRDAAHWITGGHDQDGVSSLINMLISTKTRRESEF